MTTENILDKIRKLLRLARDKGASPAEAENAMAMASAMMLKYNIEHVPDEQEQRRRAVKGSWMNVQRGDNWEIVLAQSAALLFNCKGVKNSLGDHYFVGLPENIEAAEATFLWLCEQVEAQYQDGLKAFKTVLKPLDKRMQQKVRGDFRRSFKDSCAMKVWQRAGEINAFNRGNIPDHKALVVIDNSLQEAADLIADLKPGRNLTLKQDGFGSGAGRAAGDHIQLNRATGGNQRRLT